MRQVMPSAAQPTSSSISIPAPTGGWNARDPIAAMPATDAIFLDNFFPRQGDVVLRPGSVTFATLPDDVEDPPDLHDVRSLLTYQAADGSAKLFAADQSGIYDVTAGGTVTTIASAATFNAWQHVNISTAGGAFLWCCNGVDKARYFNGTAWTVLDGTSTPPITGIVSTDITNVSLFKSRLYLCEKDSLSFWYLPVNSIAGEAQEFPLGAIFRRGGYLVATDSWTLDGGNGPEDYFVAVTSEGEVAVYTGTNPASAATWSLQGVYFIGAPIGRRCFLKLGGDLCLLTVRGLYPLSKALLSATVDTRSAISDKISQAWLDYAALAKDFFGWQPIAYPEAGFLLVNVPVVSSQPTGQVYSYQFVMNTQTGAWCRFLNMPAEVWGTCAGKLYFALHNKVYQAWTGLADARGPLDGRVKTAFMYPAGRGNLARITLLRPIFQTSTSKLRLQLAIDSDFDESSIATSAISYSQGVAVWDQSKWDESYWTASQVTSEWRSVAHKPGRAISLRLRILGKDITLSWNATDLILQRGGML